MMREKRGYDPFKVLCRSCNTIAVSWHDSWPGTPPGGVERGFDTCLCGNVDAEALPVPGTGSVFGGKHGEFQILT
ncbi:hypothetical protein L598_006200000130 [Mesorhizobium sp. J18]|nr:hypothetical protein L598_006200000130 [Mesorhizobium sp. J18]